MYDYNLIETDLESTKEIFIRNSIYKQRYVEHK